MKLSLGLRVMLTLFALVLVPLELGHCSWVPDRASTVAGDSGHHDEGDDCCPQASPSELPPPTGSCCCGGSDLLPATTPASLSMAAATSPAPSIEVVAPNLATAEAKSVSARLEPDARSAPPPHPSTSPQSPRSPPYSA